MINESARKENVQSFYVFLRTCFQEFIYLAVFPRRNLLLKIMRKSFFSFVSEKSVIHSFIDNQQYTVLWAYNIYQLVLYCCSAECIEFRCQLFRGYSVGLMLSLTSEIKFVIFFQFFYLLHFLVRFKFQTFHAIHTKWFDVEYGIYFTRETGF